MLLLGDHTSDGVIHHTFNCLASKKSRNQLSPLVYVLMVKFCH